MRLNSPWEPRLSGSGPASEQLVAALAGEILDGRLEAGDRLPAQRDLAWRLEIGLGTVTKAYGILERRGLIRTVKGRGTFVSLVQTRRGPLIDLSHNVPPAVLSERSLARTLGSLSKRIDAGLFSGYPPPGGHDEHRRLMAAWLGRLGMAADPDGLVLTSGALHAISVAVTAATGGRGTLLTEAQSYPGVIELARHRGLALAGVATDAEGMLPGALARALAGAVPPVAVYVTPTMQNPTTATMGRQRREEIVAVIRAAGAWLIEDDVYTLEADPALPPLSMLAPDCSYYANSMSKTLTPTLRLGALVAPEGRMAAVQSALAASGAMVSPLSCAVLEQWMMDGTAEAVSGAVQAEAAARTEMARAHLAAAMQPRGRLGYHVWLPMPKAEARQIALAARSLGLELTQPEATDADPGAGQGGLRICLGASSRAELEIALPGIARLWQELRAGGGQRTQVPA
ncbi:PLP-dependent aminotransferase family protein [Poseidonocella sp. HB161398]|uniref:aminotransferase-like domain-containing protein n=1 Tax=Poseidonocella sp. HB161398 TaxID=2320855 RepID=UPI0011096BC9|nr:PLP-dependent aminotransferase family protein [Poseidonocella sp. HB161398]